MKFEADAVLPWTCRDRQIQGSTLSLDVEERRQPLAFGGSVEVVLAMASAFLISFLA